MRYCKLDLRLNYIRKTHFYCSLQVGDWKIKVTGGGEYAASLVYTLSGVGETARGSDSNFVIAASLGKNIETEIFPTMTSLPVYASVSTLEEPFNNGCL